MKDETMDLNLIMRQVCKVAANWGFTSIEGMKSVRKRVNGDMRECVTFMFARHMGRIKTNMGHVCEEKHNK